jgi:mannosyl-oligosaccharide glucosidase
MRLPAPVRLLAAPQPHSSRRQSGAHLAGARSMDVAKPAIALGGALLAVAALWLLQSDTATAPAAPEGFDRCLADPAQWLHPLPLPSALGAFPAAHNASLLWGSYRPAVYFGLRTRTFPASVFGLFWHGPNADRMRHQCSEGDPIRRYGWEEHDGRAYGSQRIFDDKADGGVGAILHTSFVKPAELDAAKEADVHWAARVAVERSTSGGGSDPTVMYLYYGLDCDGELGAEECAERSQPAGAAGLAVDRADDGSVSIVGESASLGAFSLRIAASGASSEISAWGGSGVVIADVQEKIAEFLQKRARKAKGKKAKASISLPNKVQKGSNVVVVRIACDEACSVDAVLSKAGEAGSDSKAAAVVSGEQVSAWLDSGSQRFWGKFGEVFGELTDFAEEDKKAAAAAVANAIGGMGYFHGRMPVEPAGGGGELSSFPVALFTAVPSRPFFPRGFAWDEGFHQLLIRRWDADIAADSLAHWMGTLHTCVNEDEACSGLGWLPREQTLGEEARRRVPEQFRKQSPSIANPPTLVLLADALLKASKSGSSEGSAVDVPELLRLLRPRLEQWVAWLLASQRPPAGGAAAPGDGDYQWRGRSTSDGKLNPNTLGKHKIAAEQSRVEQSPKHTKH